MADYRDFDDVIFIAGVTFQSEHGVHEAGSEVKEAKEFQNLQVLVARDPRQHLGERRLGRRAGEGGVGRHPHAALLARLARRRRVGAPR